jgi:ubiquinone/menaquinone biosynthesis C-methylase UbiE
MSKVSKQLGERPATKMKTESPSSNVEWKAWAKRDPLFAIATIPEKDKNGAAPWSDDEFYALGKSDWDDFHTKWRHYGLKNDGCVEIGCGAGRITKHLCKAFKTVHAFDISEDMLNYAQRHLTEENLRFQVSNGSDLRLPGSSVSAVFSCHVFQHFDSLSVARLYFEEIYRVLCEGGTLMIHLPIHCWPYDSVPFEVLHWMRKSIDDLKASVKRKLITVGIFRPLMRRLTYPVPWLYAELPKIGFSDVEISFVTTTTNHDPHAFVFARKRASGLSPDKRVPTPTIVSGPSISAAGQ